MPLVVGCSDDVSCESRSRDSQALSSAHTIPGIRAVAGSAAAVTCRRAVAPRSKKTP